MKKKHRASIQNKRFQLRIVSPCHKDYDIYLLTISKTYAMEMLSQYSSLGFQCELSKFNLKSSQHYSQENDCVTKFFIDNRLSTIMPLCDEFRALHFIHASRRLEEAFDSYLYYFYNAANITMRSLLDLYINKKNNNQLFETLSEIAILFSHRESTKFMRNHDFYIDELSLFKNMINEILTGSHDFLPF